MRKYAPVLGAVAVAVLVLGLLLILSGCAASNNVTCKEKVTTTQGNTTTTKYKLCVDNGNGGTRVIYVPYAQWNKTAVGGYYDEKTGKGYTNVDEDPAAPHGFGEGGDGGGEGHGGGGGE